MVSMESAKHIYVPKVWILLYAAMGLVLVPWVFDLAYSLPARHVAIHWDVVWVGFDTMLIAMIVLTVYFALRRQIWIVISTTALATLFMVDAWFDILTSKPGREQRIAVFFGVVEICLALLTFRLVHHVVKHATSHDRLKLVPKSRDSAR